MQRECYFKSSDCEGVIYRIEQVELQHTGIQLLTKKPIPICKYHRGTLNLQKKSIGGAS